MCVCVDTLHTHTHTHTHTIVIMEVVSANILCQGLLHKKTNLVGMMNVSFDVTSEILIMNSAFIKLMWAGIFNSVEKCSK
jgi:hypothetical protein